MIHISKSGSENIKKLEISGNKSCNLVTSFDKTRVHIHSEEHEKHGKLRGKGEI